MIFKQIFIYLVFVNYIDSYNNRTLFSQFRIIRVYDELYIFFKFLNNIQFLYSVLKFYFYSKGIDFYSNISNLSENVYTYLAHFSVSKFFNFNLNLKKTYIKNYKLRIKMLVKSSFNLSMSKLLELLNKEIHVWIRSFGMLTSYSLRKELDLYFYKLLWRFVKRLHSRRNNTWIYQKYWGKFIGIYKFSYFDVTLGRFVFLRTHTYNLNLHFCFPLYLDFYSVYNYKKVYFSIYKKSRFTVEGITKILFIKQKGLCSVCFKPLDFYFLKTISSNCKTQYNNKVLDLFLVHNYCFK